LRLAFEIASFALHTRVQRIGQNGHPADLRHDLVEQR
jgi:hypothetical protein